ncbi:MAG: sigma-70 family RNA polymerase sigma factor [Pirellulaceae bacterium]|nr:sigma-70 family RNA polymerase sigma factor [Pirellulaceae bacterium]
MTQSPSLSSQFLLRLCEMQASAWSRLVESFSPIVYAWCRRAGLPGHDAADVVQDVFATVARKIHQFDHQRPGASFSAWLATITRTRLADFFRRRTGQPQATGGSDALAWLQAVPDLEHDEDSRSQFQAKLIGRVLEMVEEEFEPRTWQAFRMTAIENRSAAEVAQQLSISIASVYQARCRVLRRLKQRLGELPQ